MDEQRLSHVGRLLREAAAALWGEKRAAELEATQTGLISALATIRSATLELEDEPDFVDGRALP